MKSRLLVAAVGIPLLLVILFACPKIVTAVAVALLSAIGARELLHTTGIVGRQDMVIFSMIMAFLVPIWSYFGSPIVVGAAAAVVFGLLLFVEALGNYPEVKFESVTGAMFAGLVIPLCLSSVVRIMIMEKGRHLVLVPILIPFLADAGAYFAGRFLGKHKMAPVLSPNKTTEGAVGGILTGIVSMLLYGLVMQFAFGLHYNYLYAAIYGLLGALVSIVGDLAFSMVKRETGIKDYGTLFRAHGGVLDRFDSVIFAAPVVELLLLILPLLG
jgi:phosphatidate cytidylyltransferase